MEFFSEKENNTSHDNADILCDPCEGNNETKTAENYCVDCNEFLCDGCAKVHRKSKMSLQHIILDGLKMPKKKLVLSGEDVCSRHDGKALEYFCNNHGGFYCAPCVTLEHRSCSLKYLTEEAKGFSDSEDYRAIIAKIQKVNQRIFQTKDKIQVCTDEAKSNHLNFLQEIQEFRNKIETVVQSVEDTAKEKANVIQQKDLDAFDTFSSRSEEMANETGRLSEELDNLRACEQQSRLFLAAKRIETKLDTIDTELHEMDSKARPSRYNFRGKEIMKINVESWGNHEVLEISDKQASLGKINKDKYGNGSKIMQKKEFAGWPRDFKGCKKESSFPIYEEQLKSYSCVSRSKREVDSEVKVSYYKNESDIKDMSGNSRNVFIPSKFDDEISLLVTESKQPVRLSKSKTAERKMAKMNVNPKFVTGSLLDAKYIN